jgi:hypothetical protein
MSTLHRHPRQDRRNVGRAPVRPNVRSLRNPKCKTTAAQSAAIAIARKKNRADRPPLLSLRTNETEYAHD